MDDDTKTFGYRWTDSYPQMIYFPDLDPSKCQQTLQLPLRQATHSPLERLPLEILHRILSLGTPADLVALGSTSSSCYEAVRSLPSWKALTTHAAQALKALSATRLLNHYPLKQLHDTLRSECCMCCGAYGAYLYLLHCTRRCYKCILYPRKNRAVPVTFARNWFKTYERKPKGLIELHAVPGSYGRDGLKGGGVKTLVCAEQTMELCGIFDHPECEAHERRFRMWMGYDNRLCVFRSCVPFPSLSGAGAGSVEHGIWCRGCEDTWHWSLRSGRPISGPMNAEGPRDTAYSAAGFREHCLVCPGIAEFKSPDYLRVKELVPHWKPFTERN